MNVTRADFLRYLSAAAGLGTAISRYGLPRIAAGATAVPDTGGEHPGSDNPGPSNTAPPPPPSRPGRDLLDSQRFRRAVADGDLAGVRDYLERDPALAWSRDETARSVFVIASLSGHAEIAAAIRPHLDGLDLVEATLAGDAARAAELLEKFPRLINEIHPIGGSAVHVAARRGRPDLLMAFLRPGPNFNLPSKAPEALTPLRLAIDFPDPAVAEEMLDLMAGNGADSNAAQGDGLTPLHAAARADSAEIVRLLLFDGADPAARASLGPHAHNMPPTWFPAIGGGTPDHLEIARVLLDAGADPNAHKRGYTALHWAARGGQVEMADLLLARGADPNAKAKTPQGDVTPLALALKAEKKDVAERLRRNGAVA